MEYGNRVVERMCVFNNGWSTSLGIPITFCIYTRSFR
jgi:hypothetical protein